MTHIELSRLLDKHGMTQIELARAVGKGADKISQWISGKAKMSQKTQLLLEEYFASKKSNESELHLLPFGTRFRIPGNNRIFKKVDNNKFIFSKVLLPDGSTEVQKKPACKCYNSLGYVFIKGWYDKVIIVEKDE